MLWSAFFNLRCFFLNFRRNNLNGISSASIANTLQHLGLNHTVEARPASQPANFARTQSVNGGFTVHSPTIAAQQPVSINPTASRYSPSTVGYSPYAPKPQSPTTPTSPNSYQQRQTTEPIKQYRPVNYNPTPTAYQAPAAQYQRQSSDIQPQFQSNIYSPTSTTTPPLYSPTPVTSRVAPPSTLSQIPSHNSPVVEQFGSFTIPTTDQVLSEQLNGTHITVRQGETLSTGFQQGVPQHQPAVYHTNGHPVPSTNQQQFNMNGTSPQVINKLLDKLHLPPAQTLRSEMFEVFRLPLAAKAQGLRINLVYLPF